jgi:hypothetical protein
MQSTLEISSAGHSYQTRYAGCQSWHLLCVGMYHLAGKMCVHVPCSMNDQSDLILHLL